MGTIPFYIYLTFTCIVLAALLLFYKASSGSVTFIKVVVPWIVFQTIVSLTGFYQTANTMPPRFALLFAPPLLFIAFLLISKKGRHFLDSLDPGLLTLFHTIRLPIEIVLYWFLLYKLVPPIMTFEGQNFDLFSGITAPVIYYVGYAKKQLGTTTILIWNIACLLLLARVIYFAVLSLPSPFQHFGFDQPNIAVLHFPFIFLPSCLVPLVLISHVAVIRQILMKTAHGPSHQI